QIASDQSRRRRLDCIALVILGLLAFGIGYDFWIVCFFATGGALLFSIRPALLSVRSLRKLGWFLAAFVSPVLLRQLQIAVVLGPDFWLKDLIYSALIKVSVVNFFLPLASLDEVDSFYAAAGVLRPPASPPSSVDEVLRTLSDMLAQVTIPSFGLVT